MAASITDFSEMSFFVVDFLGKKHFLDSSGSRGFILGLLATHDAASLIFDYLITSRSTVLNLNRCIHHSHKVLGISKVTYEQFFKILQYDKTISNEKWEGYLFSICKPEQFNLL